MSSNIVYLIMQEINTFQIMICTQHATKQKIQMESLQLRFFERLYFQALEYLKEIEGVYFLMTLKDIVET